MDISVGDILSGDIPAVLLAPIILVGLWVLSFLLGGRVD